MLQLCPQQGGRSCIYKRLLGGYVSLGSPCLTTYSGSESSAFSLARVAALHFSITTQFPPAPRTSPAHDKRNTYTHDICQTSTNQCETPGGQAHVTWGRSQCSSPQPPHHTLETHRKKTCFKRARLSAPHDGYTTARLPKQYTAWASNTRLRGASV